jgi:hypothetical protein
MAGQHAQPALAERGDHTPVCLSASSSSEMSLNGLSRSALFRLQCHDCTAMKFAFSREIGVGKSNKNQTCSPW